MACPVCGGDHPSDSRACPGAGVHRPLIDEHDTVVTPSPILGVELLPEMSQSPPGAWPVDAEGADFQSLVETPGPPLLVREHKHSQAVPMPGPAVKLDRPAYRTSSQAAPRPAPPRAHRPSSGRTRLIWLLGIPAALVGAAAVTLHLRSGTTRNAPSLAPQERCKVTLAVDPPDAVVRVDHLPVERDELFLEPGTSHIVEAEAPGRISRRVAFTTRAGLELSVHLGRTLMSPSLSDTDPLPSELTIRYPIRPASRDEIHRAFTKLDRYAKCLAVLGFGDVRKVDPTAVPSNAILSTCIQATEEANALLPPMVPLHTACAAYLRAASAGEPGGTLNRLLSVFRSQFLATQASWQTEELSRQEADEGRTVGWHMRRVALAAQTWSRASRAGAPPTRSLKDARTRLEEYQQALLDLAKQSPQEIERISGAGAFLKSVEEVMALARGESGKRLDARAAADACHRLVAAFNALVV